MPDLLARYDGKTVVVTGARGYIGTALASTLARTSAHLTLVSRRRPDLANAGGRSTDRVAWVVGDIRERSVWDEVARDADVVFHLAGNTSVYAAAADPAESFRSTVLPIAHVTAAAQAAGRAPRVVYASTATVYGLPEHLPVDERVPPKPVTEYDRHKWSAEQQLALASQQGVVDAVSLRLANVYGPSAGTAAATERGVLNAIAARALRGADLPLYGNGRYLRDYVYIDDVVDAFMAAGLAPGVAGQALNVASGRGVTVRDAFQLVADRARALSGRTSRVCPVSPPADADPIEFRNYVADVGRIAAACGWTPRVPLPAGIDRLLTFLLTGRPVETAGTCE